VRGSYFNERGFRRARRAREIAGEHRTSFAAVALAWLLAQPTVVAPIASATSSEQLGELSASTEVELTFGELEHLDAVSG